MLFIFLLIFLLFNNIYGIPVQADELETLTIREENATESSPEGSFERACRTKTLCPEGISNIVIGGLLFGFLGCFACAMWQWEVQAERRARINMALARNREIDRQIEAARQYRQQYHQTTPPTHPHSVEIPESKVSLEESRTTGTGLRDEGDKTALLGHEAEPSGSTVLQQSDQ
uniref:Uncharacterized protein n=1 Tax=Amphimedon queenslandica TaxID=400682 RepID=A0A1X7SUH1_AMPQE